MTTDDGAAEAVVAAPDKNKILLLDASPIRQKARAVKMRSKGAIVECAETGAEATAMWKPGSHELVLIDFRGAGTDLYDFYRLALASSRSQKFGFYTDLPPYISSSWSDRSGDGDDEKPRLLAGELQTLLHRGTESARYRGGVPEAARRIAAIRPLAQNAPTGAKPVSFSNAVKAAERALGVGE
jgi:CheY-like chemotaxis protein